METNPRGQCEERNAGDPRERARRRRRRFRHASEGVSMAVHLAPMIDVAFLLLIFFLVTTTFERAEGILASELPRTNARPVVALPISPIVIRVSQIGMDEKDYSISVDRFQDVPQSFAELTGFLRRIQQQPGFDQNTPVVIVADNDVRWDHVVDCFNAALRAECSRIAFAEP